MLQGQTLLFLSPFRSRSKEVKRHLYRPLVACCPVAVCIYLDTKKICLNQCQRSQRVPNSYVHLYSKKKYLESCVMDSNNSFSEWRYLVSVPSSQFKNKTQKMLKVPKTPNFNSVKVKRFTVLSLCLCSYQKCQQYLHKIVSFIQPTWMSKARNSE